jgi:hypothetical protein
MLTGSSPNWSEGTRFDQGLTCFAALALPQVSLAAEGSIGEEQLLTVDLVGADRTLPFR